MHEVVAAATSLAGAGAVALPVPSAGPATTGWDTTGWDTTGWDTTGLDAVPAYPSTEFIAAATAGGPGAVP